MEKIGEIKIRIPLSIAKGEVIPIKALIKHPMETGFRTVKETGQTIPAHYINDVSVYYGERLITRFNWTFAISADPFITIFIRADMEAPLRVVYKDSEGGVYEKSVLIVPR